MHVAGFGYKIKEQVLEFIFPSLMSKHRDTKLFICYKAVEFLFLEEADEQSVSKES